MESSKRNGLKEMGNEKITAPDHHDHHHHQINGLKRENGDSKSETFIVDLSSLDKDSITNATSNINSRITLQRSLSRKGPQRGTERKVNERDPLVPSSSSPRATQVLNMLEKPILSPVLSLASQDLPKNNQEQHQITIKTGSVNTIATYGRWGNRSSFKRTPPSWFFDPKRILLFFATLSSMGTILLIYFTLSMRNHHEKDDTLDWQ